MSPGLLALLAGCGVFGGGGAPGGEDVHTATVDCLGLFYDPTGGPLGEQALSHVWSYSLGSATPEHRCLVQWATGQEGAASLPAMRADELFNASSRGEPYANMTVRIAGREYNSADGELVFDHFEAGKASGTYAIEAQNLSGLFDPGEDWKALITGRFDWCDIRRTDCPHRSSGAGLNRPFELSTDQTHGAGDAIDCRILHDSATEAIRIDLQMGTWNGINVSEYLLDACFDFGGNPPQGNHFTLQATGVPGPGTYALGPRRTLRYGMQGYVTPGEQVDFETFTWTHPAVFQDELPGYALCEAYNRQARVSSPPDGGGCTYTVADGTFELDCDRAEYSGLGFFGDQEEETPLHLEVECDWVQR